MGFTGKGRIPLRMCPWVTKETLLTRCIQSDTGAMRKRSLGRFQELRRREHTQWKVRGDILDKVVPEHRHTET